MQDTVLETKDLSRAFGGLQAVDGVNLRVGSGSLHSIIGPNGAGKTTLFNLISGTIKPTHGHVYLRGREITGTPLHRMAHLGIGRSFQITNVFPNLTVLENTRLAAQALGRDNLKLWARAAQFRQYQETALAALRQVGLADKASLPAAVLPHGDKRKLELAVAMARRPSLLLLDEPMAGVAMEDVPSLTRLIADLNADGMTICMVEHHMHVVLGLAHRIAVLHHGRLLAVGTPAEVTADPEVRRAYLGDSL